MEAHLPKQITVAKTNTMTGLILNLLKQEDFFNLSKEVEIAKGKNKLPTSVKGVFKQARRAYKFK